MRLINADVLICYLQTLQAVNSGDALFCNDLEDFIDHIEELPTAYDVESVVEQLEKASYWTEPTYDEDGYSYDDEIEVIDLSDAIEIVKGGAV